MSSGDNIYAERLKKLELLKQAGINPYPAKTGRTHSISEFVSGFEQFEGNQTSMCLVGRVMSIRGQGGILFVDLFDGTGRAQAVIQKAEIDESSFQLFVDAVDQGDFIEVSGTAFVTKRGEKSLKTMSWEMLSKSLKAVPSEWYGIKDEEARLRQRYLDLLLDGDMRELFIRRAAFWNSIRTFLIERGFLEVETPVLETSPGGADARPFITHHNALDMDAYLRISVGELWQKRLLVAGFPKVFEIGRVFRNEGQSREHAQDYTACEFYQAYADYTDGMKTVRDLYLHVVDTVYGKRTFEIQGENIDFGGEWPVIDYVSTLNERFGINPITSSEAEVFAAVKKAGIPLEENANKARAVDVLWKSIRKEFKGPAFLINTPVYLEPLAKRKEDMPEVVERFQVLLLGSEMGKGFSELNDPLDQKGRFDEQQAMRDAGDEEAQRLDMEFIEALEYGMPPAFGFGVSERLFSLLEGKSIHEAQLFPLLRPKN